MENVIQIIDLASKNLKAAISIYNKRVKTQENMFKQLKENMVLMSEQIENLSEKQKPKKMQMKFKMKIKKCNS